MSDQTSIDSVLMRQAVDLSRAHLAQTGTNPSVGTLIVDPENGAILGRGVTALGGRPHAEPIALAEAGDSAKGATAYVTLEPCAHHGKTPPCANTLVDAGIARVVCALSDPDMRVAGRGFAILRDAGIEVVTDIEPGYARTVLKPYLTRAALGRPAITLKMATSTDGKIGLAAGGQMQITGEETRKAVHTMRARHNAIMVGIGTVLEDDPMLDVRIAGMEHRSPMRVIVDSFARLPLQSQIVQSASAIKTLCATAEPQSSAAKALEAHGVQIIACEALNGKIAIPELMDDLGALGLQSVFVEGGAQLAASLLSDDLVDDLVLITGPGLIGVQGIPAPVTPQTVSAGFVQTAADHYGADTMITWERKR